MARKKSAMSDFQQRAAAVPPVRERVIRPDPPVPAVQPVAEPEPVQEHLSEPPVFATKGPYTSEGTFVLDGAGQRIANCGRPGRMAETGNSLAVMVTAALNAME